MTTTALYVETQCIASLRRNHNHPPPTTTLFNSISNVHSQDLRNEVKTHFRTESRTIDSLKSAFFCDSISFAKWDEEYANITDSTFSINFINSKKLPHTDFKQMISIFNRISQSIKSSLKNPEKYNSYQIVFLTVDDLFGFGKIESPTLQMVVRVDDFYGIDKN